MADMNVKILHYGDGAFDRQLFPIGAVEVAKGDFVSLESNTIQKVDAATDDATFVGIAEQDHASTDTVMDKILVIQKAIVKATVTSASYNFGDGLKYNTSGYLEADGGANTIAWAWEDTASASVTSLKVLIDVVKLAKLGFGIDA